MKYKYTKLLLTVVGLVLIAIALAWAQVSVSYTYQLIMRGQTATGTTSSNIVGTGSNYHQVTWNVTGTPGGCSFTIDSSVDGVTWSTGGVIGATTCTSNGVATSTSVTPNYVRINLSTFSGGTNPTFTAVLDGYANNPVSSGGTVTSITCGTGITCSPGSPITSSGTISSSASGGALVQVESHTCTAVATCDFTTGITSAYHFYKFIFNQVSPVTNGSTLQMRFSSNGGTSYDTGTNYSDIKWLWNSGGTGVPAADAAAGQFTIIGNGESSGTTAGGLMGWLDIANPLDNTHAQNFMADFHYFNGSTETRSQTSGNYAPVSPVAVNAVRFLYSAGNVASGTITLYGVTP